MKRIYPPFVLVAMAMFVAAPFWLMGAPDMKVQNATPSVLLTYKIFFYHVPAAMVTFLAAFVCGVASALYLFRRQAVADRLAVAAAELTVAFGLIVLVTGPLWARKAWGVWWQWDARLTSTLLMWMIFVAYLLVRRFGGPGSEKLSAAMAIFGMANVPFVYVSVNIWRTMHPTTSVVPTLDPGMRGPFWFCVLAFLVLAGLLLALRARLEQRRADVEHLHLLADEDYPGAHVG
jgi:heme exporter protein C